MIVESMTIDDFLNDDNTNYDDDDNGTVKWL